MNGRPPRGLLAIPATLVVTVIACSASRPATTTGRSGAGGGASTASAGGSPNASSSKSSTSGGGGNTGAGGDAPCTPVLVPDASVVTYACADGRTCDPPDPSEIDAGVYQICPGPMECATLVSYDGGSTLGFC